jgi:hypothetical protein
MPCGNPIAFQFLYVINVTAASELQQRPEVCQRRRSVQ